ncbi:MAG: hypothetical protein GY903_10525 [Fuerstiella sp.]|nr:hypothetical protein [Fuerstiella sp.]MCP4782104.1 hypothetical protein [Fuerstiella sp.]MCP4854913.1 hypothetical protein [Fuerstiella sp.]
MKSRYQSALLPRNNLPNSSQRRNKKRQLRTIVSRAAVLEAPADRNNSRLLYSFGRIAVPAIV